MHDDTHKRLPAEITIPTEDPSLVINATIRLGSPVVIFSHGFGVKRDSRGMFTDIADRLPSNYGYTLYDYNNVDGIHVHLRSYSQQVTILKSVIEYISLQTKVVHLVGHSMGAIVAALCKPDLPRKIILLAPPVATSAGRKFFAEYPGAYRDDENTLIVPRKDGTMTHVKDDFFDEAESVNPLKVMAEYASFKSLVVIQATGEDVLKNTENYDKLPSIHNIKLLKLPGNHNFDPPNRIVLINTILNLI